MKKLKRIWALVVLTMITLLPTITSAQKCSEKELAGRFQQLNDMQTMKIKDTLNGYSLYPDLKEKILYFYHNGNLIGKTEYEPTGSKILRSDAGFLLVILYGNPIKSFLFIGEGSYEKLIPQIAEKSFSAKLDKNFIIFEFYKDNNHTIFDLRKKEYCDPKQEPSL